MGLRFGTHSDGHELQRPAGIEQVPGEPEGCDLGGSYRKQGAHKMLGVVISWQESLAHHNWAFFQSPDSGCPWLRCASHKKIAFPIVKKKLRI